MEEKDELYVYRNGQICAHCIWISEEKPKVNYIPKLKNYIPIGTYLIDNQGVTIFQSDKFRYTFNCMYGYKNNQINNHSVSNFSTLISCSVWFIEHMHEKIGIKKFRLVLNSSFSERYGEKEHLHALVSVGHNPNDLNSSDYKKFDDFFGTKDGLQGKKGIDVGHEPYGYIIDMNSEDCKELIRTGDVSSFMYFKYNIDTSKNFYLFLYFSYEKNGKSKITGKLAF